MAQNSLLDFLQGASNAAASNISAPVDGIAWLLRKAGIPVPDAPIGGSDWMARKGLTVQPQNQLAGLLGESVGGVAPIVAAAKAPQIAKGLLQVEANAAAPRTLRPEAGAIVWHGSPHKFDRFDASKIGTGEGAQAYGHGLYLAESPDVARSYKDTLRGMKTDTQAVVEKLLPERRFTTKERAEIFKAAMDEQTPVQDAARRLGYRQASIRDVDQGVLQRAIAEVREQGQGSLYKVDLPDEKIARMLDWDKPLSQQAPEVQPALRDMLTQARKSFSGIDPSGNPMAGQVHHLYVQHRGGNKDAPVKAADFLRQQGIPGIRYLDGGSRGAGAGTSNFVVFPGEEQFLRILERNGGLLGP